MVKIGESFDVVEVVRALVEEQLVLYQEVDRLGERVKALEGNGSGTDTCTHLREAQVRCKRMGTAPRGEGEIVKAPPRGKGGVA